MRLADHPWGPWSAPQTIFNPMRDAGYCHFIHRAVAPGNPACDNVSAPNRLGVPGGDYGPYFISRFTTGDEAREHIDELSRKYVGTEYRNPIGPQGRIILKIAADKVNTPKSLGRR